MFLLLIKRRVSPSCEGGRGFSATVGDVQHAAPVDAVRAGQDGQVFVIRVLVKPNVVVVLHHQIAYVLLCIKRNVNKVSF